MNRRLLPVSHAELVRRLKRLGFDGPYAGGRHLFMIRGDLRLTIPNPHRGDLDVSILKRLLDQSGISRQEWDGAAE